jgi:hypothetical protein
MLRAAPEFGVHLTIIFDELIYVIDDEIILHLTNKT